jgi:hypothetical protein
MASIWWVLAAFVGGGSAGVLVIALMHAMLAGHSAREPSFDRLSL